MSEPIPNHIAVQLAGSELWLLADKAVWWPAEQALLIADIHIGKAATYRALGQPVPHGTTASNLQRLDALLARFPCRQLIFLGDFLHAPQAQTPAVLRALSDWRATRPDLYITLICGNHDKRAGDPPASLDIEVVTEPLLVGPFALQHEPQPHATHHVLAGHLHPAYRLRGRGRQSVRLPCFVLGTQVSLLPSFGSFTGGMCIETGAEQRLYVVGDGGVWPVHHQGRILGR